MKVIFLIIILILIYVIYQLYKENKSLKEENLDLRFETEELDSDKRYYKRFLDELIKAVEINTYGNEKLRKEKVNKINKILADYQLTANIFQKL